MDNKYFNTQSPAFSSFRELMDIWDCHNVIQEQKDKINKMFDDHELSLFFKKGEDYFGAPEHSRIVFAKLKSGDEDDPMTPGFREQAKFLALNLLKAMMGGEDPSETMFGLNDIPQISICDREDAIDKIMTHKPKTDKKDKKDKDE